MERIKIHILISNWLLILLGCNCDERINGMCVLSKWQLAVDKKRLSNRIAISDTKKNGNKTRLCLFSNGNTLCLHDGEIINEIHVHKSDKSVFLAAAAAAATIFTLHKPKL